MRRLKSIALAFACALATLLASNAATAAIQKIDTSFLVDGRSVRVEIFRPSGKEQKPAALVLHGASGIGSGWFVYPFARALAVAGVAAAVVHYYDGLGGVGRKASAQIFERRDRIIDAAIGYVISRPDIRSDGVGIYGMSLGGFHALSLAAQDPRVRAVVSLGGALSRHIPEDALGQMPPTLLLHGDRDRVVPLRRALSVSRAMERLGGPGHMKVYKGEGHSFSARAHADAVHAVARFLSKGLRPQRRLAENNKS